MKTLFAIKHTTIFDNCSFDVLTSEELAVIKGGKEEDSYIHPVQSFITWSVSQKKIK